MPEEKDIRTMIDEDIDRVERVWEASSYDSDALEELFRLLLEHYAERIEGFTKRLKVIQPYEDIADMAENYRENVQTLLERMKLFRENGYSNEGLIEYSIAKEREELNFNADFTTVRLEIGMMQGLSLAEREDIMVHLDAMETIGYGNCAHFRLQIIGCNLGRGYQPTILIGIGFLHAAVEEKRNVCIFFCFRRSELLQPQRGNIFP